MKTLFIHIGMPKTGTTAIQKFCMENRKQLKRNGFCYPVFPYHYYGKGKNRNAVFLTKKNKDKKAEGGLEENQRVFAEGMSIIKEKFQKYDNIIISDEGIWNYIKKGKFSLLKELHEISERDGYTIKMIVYLRRQDEYGVSAWNQRIKKKTEPGKKSYTWENFINNSGDILNLDYYQTLEAASTVLGKENIIVRRYGRKYLKDGLSQADFLDALGLEWTDGYHIRKKEWNEKLSLNCCEIKRVINDIPEISALELRLFQYALSNITKISEEEYPCVLWSADDARNFMSRYEEDNRKIAETFIQDGQSLFSDEFTEREVWYQNNPHMQSDIIRFTASSDIMLMREQQELYLKIDELNEQVAKLQKQVEMLCCFRMKIKHPFKTLFYILNGRF